MTITRAKKSQPTHAKKTENNALTPERFIAGAEAPPAPPQAAPATPNPSHETRALAVVKTYIPWAAGAGVLPLPGIDIAAILGVQLRMLAKLSETYGVPFKEQAAKSMIATLMAAVLENSLAGGFASALKLIPGIGTVLGIAALPAIAAAGTFAVGKVFITHFEAGGTFLDFEPKKVEAHFHAEFENARKNRPD